MANIAVSSFFCVTLFLVLSSIPSSYQIKCYSCVDGSVSESRKISKEMDLPGIPDIPSCSANMNSRTCASSITSCFVASGSLNGNEFVVRDCSNGNLTEACNYIQNKRSVEFTIDCATCSTDDCNAASNVIASFVVFTLAIIFVKLF